MAVFLFCMVVKVHQKRVAANVVLQPQKPSKVITYQLVNFNPLNSVNEVFHDEKSGTSVLLMLMCIAIIIQDSKARPPWLSPSSEVFTESAECHTDDELLDLCQRCAKLTKSKLAYPACCSTDIEARKWCSDYVYFGRGQYDFYSI